MKTHIKFTALLATVLMFVACKPEPVEVERDITYTVDETTTTVHLRTDAEFEALLDRFCDYAENGSSVTFHNANITSKSVDSKDVTRFSTTNRQEMKRWMRAQEDAGKTVNVTYDSGTGTYHGMAYATAPQPQSDWVDMGLPSGVLWAKCNLGANSPEEYGNYYAWGETNPKEVYNWNTYRYCTADDEGNLLTLIKYNTSSDYGTPDNLTILRGMDDAAIAILGNGAHTPTKEEWQELINYSTVEWTTFNGVNGRKFTSIINGNTLFFPAAGFRYGSELYGVDGCGNGFYWSSSLDTDNPSNAKSFTFDNMNMNNSGNSYRRYGFTVRAVRLE